MVGAPVCLVITLFQGRPVMHGPFWQFIWQNFLAQLAILARFMPLIGRSLEERQPQIGRRCRPVSNRYAVAFGRGPPCIELGFLLMRSFGPPALHAVYLRGQHAISRAALAVSARSKRSIIQEMKERYSKAVTSLALETMRLLRKPDEPSLGVVALSTIVGFQVQDDVPETAEDCKRFERTTHHERTLELALADLQQQRTFFKPI
jgi:hypothetical protein